VHPTDEFARANEGGIGKTELWYVVDAEKDAHIYYGFSRPISKDEMRQRIEDQTLAQVLNRVPVRPGDVFLIQAGTIHSIGAGILMAEVQQNSDITYRVYDYDRRDALGLAREMHIEKALAVTDTTFVPGPAMTPAVSQMDGHRRSRLTTCEYFSVDLLDVDTFAAMTCDHTSFVSLLFLGGNGRIIFADQSYGDNGVLQVKTWDSLYLPAGTGPYRLEGSCRVLITTP
jgi:mannose-6-phosphate isomerase